MDEMRLLCCVSFVVLTHVCTLCFGRSAILMHSCFVTYTLISIILDFKDVFKRLQIPKTKYRKAIVLFSLLYQINPILMTVRIKTNVYVHLCACFMLHTCHMHYVTVVFRVMNYKDHKHWMILFVVHVLEMCTNVFLVWEHEKKYLYAAIVTESICPYVLMYIKKRSKRLVSCVNFDPSRVNNRRMILYNRSSVNTLKKL